MKSQNGDRLSVAEVAQRVKALRDELLGGGEIFLTAGLFGQSFVGLVVEGEEGHEIGEDLIDLRPYLVVELPNCRVDVEDGINEVD